MLVLGGVVLLGAGSPPTSLDEMLKRLFPAAVQFSMKEGQPPHFTAYTRDPRSGQQAVFGFAFWTTELAPLERGYDGPIKMLVGMDTHGILTGVIVVEHHEPYGSFSIEPPQFSAQFAGKNIGDPFTVGRDIDAVSRATLSVTSASRAIKVSARRVARELLASGPQK